MNRWSFEIFNISEKRIYGKLIIFQKSIKIN
jgi:hypothetical protein